MPPKQKKGLSLEEKKNRLLEFFTREHDFFSIKEIESVGSKYVGVHPMQMKDLVQALLDDDLINSEKCGISIVYWCFEYDKLKRLECVKKVKWDKVVELRLKKLKVIDELKSAGEARTSRAHTAGMMSTISALQERKSALEREVEASGFSVGDLEAVKAGLQEKIALGEVCSDNIEALMAYFHRESGMERAYFQQELGIPDEFSDFPDVELLFKRLV